MFKDHANMNVSTSTKVYDKELLAQHHRRKEIIRKRVYYRISERHYAGVFEMGPKETKEKKLGDSVHVSSPRHHEMSEKCSSVT